MPWIDEKKAFPDLDCSCLVDIGEWKDDGSFRYIPVHCSICGADRSSKNWVNKDGS